MRHGSDIVEAARAFLNTPYKHQGRTEGLELDCIGLVILAAKKTGLLEAEFEFKNYSRLPNGTLESELDRNCIELDGLYEGAVVLFKMSAIPHHCGIITLLNNNLGLIHAYENVGRVREHKLIDWWKSKIVKVYGFKGVYY